MSDHIRLRGSMECDLLIDPERLIIITEDAEMDRKKLEISSFFLSISASSVIMISLSGSIKRSHSIDPRNLICC